ncbi:hypothetical protein KBC31_04900 [Candidatus Saccharibacteria bacterium]|jgi:hypothetical protein|nr:hypothetical protein [Candidatus Saccharibacteria bacterium]
MSLDSLSNNTRSGGITHRHNNHLTPQHRNRSSYQAIVRPKIVETNTRQESPADRNEEINHRLDNTLLAAIITDVLMSPIVVISTTFSNLLILALFAYSLFNRQAVPLVAAELLLVATYIVAVPIGIIFAVRQLLRKI